jgi:cytochrome P450
VSVSATSRIRGAAAAVLDRVPAPGPRPLAEPPPGSPLKQVMGEPGLPLVGQTLPMFVDSLRFCRRAYRRYGSVSWTNVIGTPAAVVLGGEAISTVLANRDGTFSSARGWDYFIGPFFERGVMLMDAPEHRHHRLIMQQAFKRERLRGYLKRMHPAVARGVSRWPVDGELRVYDALKELTLDIATEVFVGGELGAEADALNRAFVDVVVAGQALIRADVPIPGAKWHRGIASRRRLEEHFSALVASHRAGEGEDLLSVLCRAESEDGQRFSDADVVNHMIFVLMAAHDTSTITLAMMIYHLAREPEWQERLRAESEGLGTESPSYEELDSLGSIDLVFRETLRMNAPVGMIARRAMRDAEIDGYFVPAGTLLMLQIYPTHRMEPWWPDPDRFDPTRFSPERAGEPGPRDAWLPFGGHAHKCIGMHFGSMEVKAILHRLLLTRRFSVAPDYVPPLAAGTGPYPADGLPVMMRSR